MQLAKKYSALCAIVKMARFKGLFRRSEEPQLVDAVSREERAFVMRLDIFLLTFGCISQSKYLLTGLFYVLYRY